DMVCRSPVPSALRCTTSAGRRFAVGRLESGNRTRTTSPRLKGVIGVHVRPVPVLRERVQAGAQFTGLLGGDAALIQLDRTRVGEEGDDDPARPRLVHLFQQLDSPVAIGAFYGLDHAAIVSTCSTARTR